MTKALWITVLKTAGAGALGALAPLLPNLVAGMPAIVGSVLSAVVAACLLHVDPRAAAKP